MELADYHTNCGRSELTRDTRNCDACVRQTSPVQIKQRRLLLLGWVTAERSSPCKHPACPAIGGGGSPLSRWSPDRRCVKHTFLTRQYDVGYYFARSQLRYVNHIERDNCSQYRESPPLPYFPDCDHDRYITVGYTVLVSKQQRSYTS
ncbi:hypothetical protein J6590_087774 [Homalodisca vitripennis]|nr:hypothetical protein J6590_087774 [Homalodisca vitripennis]